MKRIFVASLVFIAGVAFASKYVDCPSPPSPPVIDEQTIIERWTGCGEDEIAEKIREYAEVESDPVRRKKLWNEYHNYMSSSWAGIECRRSS